MDRQTELRLATLQSRSYDLRQGMVVEQVGEAAQRLRQGCQLAGGAVPLALAVGGSTDVVVTWDDAFADSQYRARVVPLGLLGKANVAITDQTAASVTVTITALLLVAAGTQFLVHGRSLPTP